MMQTYPFHLIILHLCTLPSCSDTALAACSSPYLTCLTVSGPMRFSPHVASVMAARCAAVTSLMLNCWAEDTGDESSSPEGGESDVVVADAPPRPWEDLAAAGMAWDEGRSLGLIRLLQELGPRLKELAICKADGWRPEALAALRHCRALTKLCIDAGDEDPVELKCEDVHDGHAKAFLLLSSSCPPCQC